MIVTAATEGDNTLIIETQRGLTGYGRIQPTFVMYGNFRAVTINGIRAHLTPTAHEFAGTEQHPVACVPQMSS